MSIVRYADRPDLLERRYEELTKPTFPAYMNENEPGSLYWAGSTPTFRTSRSRSWRGTT